jgi:hypothetical protein
VRTILKQTDFNPKVFILELPRLYYYFSKSQTAAFNREKELIVQLEKKPIKITKELNKKILVALILVKTYSTAGPGAF